MHNVEALWGRKKELRAKAAIAESTKEAQGLGSVFLVGSWKERWGQAHCRKIEERKLKSVKEKNSNS